MVKSAIFLTKIWMKNFEQSEQEKKKFSGNFGQKYSKKKCPTDRLLFGIRSPAEQGLFFILALLNMLTNFMKCVWYKH